MQILHQANAHVKTGTLQLGLQQNRLAHGLFQTPNFFGHPLILCGCGLSNRKSRVALAESARPATESIASQRFRCMPATWRCKSHVPVSLRRSGFNSKEKRRDQYCQKMRCSSLLSLVLVSATAAKIRAFCGFRSCATTQSYLSSGCSALRKTKPAGTRDERIT